MLHRATLLSLIALALTGCSSPPSPADTGVDATDVAGSHDTAADVPSASTCTMDTQCSDGVFCNGAERCAPSAPDASAQGCIAGTAPCTAMQVCSESMRACTAADCTHSDADGDGHASIACGGDDCDDTDAMRFPGNTEVCAYDSGTMTRVNPTHDEDCDPSTFSDIATRDGDHDGDGYVDSACCNGTNCGNDCADLTPVAAVPASLGTSVQPQNIHPTATEVCNGVDDNCIGGIDEGDPGGGGTCANPLTEVCGPATQHCASGALACMPNSTTPPLACCAGYADCDGVVGNGCEVNVSDDANHCGTCTTVCPSASGTPACISGTCGYSACTTGLTACGGACVDVATDVDNCNGCGRVCPSVAGGVAACVASACGGTCPPGELIMGGACVSVPAPRQISPPSTATVTSQTPVLRWVLMPGDDGAQVDICRNRACSTIVTTFTVTGSSGSPSSALPAGLYYWRVHGTLAGTAGLATSAVWEFFVGARSAAINASWGTTLDVNGDGYADVVVGAWGGGSGSGRAYVYLGSSAGLGTTPATTLTGPDGANGYFGDSVASAGDVNGDGYADVVVGAYGASLVTGRSYVYLGSAAGLATTPASTLAGPDGVNGDFGSSVASAGDVNGDGYADVVIGAYGVSSNTGRAYVYLGGAGGLATTPATSLTGPDGASGSFGSSVASAGDVNGDGYADIVVGAPGASSDTGRVWAYLGSAGGIVTAPATTLTGPDGSGAYFGFPVASAGDVNGDGYADLVVGAENAMGTTGRAYVYLGGTAGLAIAPATTLTGLDGGSAFFGGSSASAGDVNGDGYADVVIGAYDASSNTGRAYVYLGSGAGLATTPATSLTGPAGANGEFGISVASAGDVNGDGRADVVVGAAAVSASTGRAYVYLGNAAGLATTPATTLTGLDGPSGNFGFCVARAGSANTHALRLPT